jgi:hypothetical protein
VSSEDSAPGFLYVPVIRIAIAMAMVMAVKTLEQVLCNKFAVREAGGTAGDLA